MLEPAYIIYLIVFPISFFLLIISERKKQNHYVLHFQYPHERENPPFYSQRPNSFLSTHEEEQFVQESFEKVKKYADFLFQFVYTKPIEVTLISRNEMVRIVGDLKSIPVGYCIRTDKYFRIYILRGLPEEQIFLTIAHEYAHIWQMTEGFMGGHEERKEGFAEWFATKIAELEGYNFDYSSFSEKYNPSLSGLRKFQIIENRFGFLCAIRAGKSNRLNLKILC